jgi:hypothetical protein
VPKDAEGKLAEEAGTKATSPISGISLPWSTEESAGRISYIITKDMNFKCISRINLRQTKKFTYGSLIGSRSSPRGGRTKWSKSRWKVDLRRSHRRFRSILQIFGNRSCYKSIRKRRTNTVNHSQWGDWDVDLGDSYDASPPESGFLPGEPPEKTPSPKTRKLHPNTRTDEKLWTTRDHVALFGCLSPQPKTKKDTSGLKKPMRWI